MQNITPDQARRFSRQILLSGFDLDKQEKLMASRVLIFGLGGLGCAAAQYIVSAGAGQVTLVDFDSVEESNLQRQILHNEQSLGWAKVESAKKRLSQIRQDCQIDTIQAKLEQSEVNELAQSHHIILDCTDNLTTRKQLNIASIKQRIPLVSGAAIRMEGQISCSIPTQNTACYQCLSQLFSEPDLSCVEAGVMSPIVGIIGAMQALEAVKILTGFGQSLQNRLMLFDGMTSTWQTFNINKNNNCTACSS